MLLSAIIALFLSSRRKVKSAWTVSG